MERFDKGRLHGDILVHRTLWVADKKRKDAEFRLKYRRQQGAPLEEKLLELAPVELQSFLKQINVFESLADEGKHLEKGFKVPGVYSIEKMELLFKMLKESWQGIVIVDYFLPQHVDAPRTLCLLLAQPSEEEELSE
jgi:hypothetical protein